MIRAAHVDLVIETGVDWAQTFEFWQPTGTPIKAQDITPGQRVYLDQVPQLVNSITRQGDGTLVKFGQGLWWQPSLWLPDNETVMPAQSVQILGAQAAWQAINGSQAIPFYTSNSGQQVTLYYADEVTAFLDLYSGTWPWDLYVSTMDLGWTRLAQGSLSIIAGVATPHGAATPHGGRRGLVHIG